MRQFYYKSVTIRRRMQTLLVLAVVICACYASGPVQYFPPDTLLNCMVQNSLGHLEGQPFSLPEDPPVIPFVPGEPGTVYLPQTSGFPTPVTGPLPDYITNRLENFLRPDSRVLSIGEETPRGPAVVPSTILPSLGDPDFGDHPGGVGTTVPPPKDYTDIITEVVSTLDPSEVGPEDHPFIVETVRRLTERCVVNATWAKLPNGNFFPQWVSGGFCSGDNCSIPAGLYCSPVLTEENLVPVQVLRWDCCWSVQNRIWRWECGWRKVYILLIGQCCCTCRDDYGALASHTGRLSGPFMPHINGVNTK